MEFKDKIVLITGSTRGIGKEIAKSFAQNGATSIIVGRNENVAKEVQKEIEAEGFNADAYGCDVTNTENVAKIINKILDKHKGIDILVNNAGITKDNLLLRMSENDWNDVLNINLKGVFICTKAVSKVMLKARKGKIISISSIIGITGNGGQANYAASKAGIIGFTKSVAQELASRGITANAIAPGYIRTDMTSELNEKTRDLLLKSIPLGRLGEASDVAQACLFIASSKADYITGQTIVVDGGMAT